PAHGAVAGVGRAKLALDGEAHRSAKTGTLVHGPMLTPGQISCKCRGGGLPNYERLRETCQAAFWRCLRPSNSAIWTAFSAAPFRRLSLTTQSERPFSTVGSSRTRETNVAYSPTHSTGVT